MQVDVDRGKGRRGKGATPGSFQPGNSAGVKKTNGTPKGRFITAQLIRLMYEEIDDPDFDPKNPKNKQKVRLRAKRVYFFCLKLVNLALSGDIQALKMVMDRIEGSPISTTIFKPTDDPDALTPDQNASLGITRAKLADMTSEQRIALYNSTLTDQSGVEGSA